MMKLIVAHNFYQQPGGEDRVFADEVALLEERGHQVEQFTLHNRSIDGRRRLGVLRDTFWNRGIAMRICDAVKRTGAEIVHFHNTFPLISPAAYYGARAAGAAVVQTLHNYRLFCPNALFLRDGKACEDCLGRRLAWPAVRHKCYRDSRTQSAAVAAMLAAHRAIGTWRRAVDVFIALTEFAREKFIQGQLPAEKIVVKPNFVHPDPGVGAGGDYAVFVGRLGPEKGVDTLLAAWSGLAEQVTLKIIGDGSLAGIVRQASEADSRIVPLGRKSLDEVCQVMGGAACIVLPSHCYEGFPRTIAEGFAKGTPIVASRLGAMAEVIEDGRTGLLFEPGNAADLADKVRSFLSLDSARRDGMRRAARNEYVEKYTARSNYQSIMSIYEQALARRWSAGRSHQSRECIT